MKGHTRPQKEDCIELPKKIRKQKVVRVSYDKFGDIDGLYLDEYLDEGWVVVMCNKVKCYDDKTILEYIIEKKL